MDVTYGRYAHKGGASLGRHTDELHELKKGRDGYIGRTRRSLSWLLYLNDPDWDGEKNGGYLRCFNRKHKPFGRVGAAENGDVQIGWLGRSATDEHDRPVYMNVDNKGSCRLYYYCIEMEMGSIARTKNTYISKPFRSSDVATLMTSTDNLVKNNIIITDARAFPTRFRLISSPSTDLFINARAGMGLGSSDAGAPACKCESDEDIVDVDAKGGTFVILDARFFSCGYTITTITAPSVSST